MFSDIPTPPPATGQTDPQAGLDQTPTDTPQGRLEAQQRAETQAGYVETVGL